MAQCSILHPGRKDVQERLGCKAKKDVKQAGTRLPISHLIYYHLQHKTTCHTAIGKSWENSLGTRPWKWRVTSEKVV